jgi:hypothetical protein
MAEASSQHNSGTVWDRSPRWVSGIISEQEVVFYAFHDGTLLGSIFMRLRTGKSVILGDILNLYGTPTCVDTFYQDVGMLLLHYDNLRVSLSISGTRFSPATPVSSRVLGRSQEYNIGSPCNFQNNEDEGDVSQRPWTGFGFIRKTGSPKK